MKVQQYGGAVGDSWDCTLGDPFESTLRLMNAGRTDEAFKDACINVNDSVKVAIDIVNGRFGKDFDDPYVVLEITKMLIHAQAQSRKCRRCEQSMNICLECSSEEMP